MTNATSRMVLVMRHAEKPDDETDPNLSPAGVARAKRLVTYIPETFGKPDLVIAASISKHSERPFETVNPLALSCGLEVRMPCADAQFAELAQRMFTDPKYLVPSSVVCWHHGGIPGLMKALGAARGSYPDPWDPRVFNLILRSEFTGDGRLAVSQVVEPF